MQPLWVRKEYSILKIIIKISFNIFLINLEIFLVHMEPVRDLLLRRKD
jgi:hypothetical protein